MRVFFREIAHGQGRQYVVVDPARRIVWQKIYASQGYSAGEGNPEFIGKTTKEIDKFWKTFRELKNKEMCDSIIRGSLGGMYCVPTELIK
ncbi:MAG: hypothetical protein HQM14_12485 [SAR324 cluster bacterium]|nr:hypothetical protein [SAR324 cluster bacterium]